MTQEELRRIQLVITHCDMLLYNMKRTFSPTMVALRLQDMIGVLHDQFAFLHLVTTMLLVDNKEGSRGGACYQLLQPLGFAAALDPILAVMEQPVGDSTFGEYVRINRNKLAVHGDLTFESLPHRVRRVTFDDDALQQFYAACEKLEEEVGALRDQLESVLNSEERST
jgi:hypothetical protein